MYVRMYSYAITEDHDFRALGIGSQTYVLLTVLVLSRCCITNCVHVLKSYKFLLKEVTGEHA